MINFQFYFIAFLLCFDLFTPGMCDEEQCKETYSKLRLVSALFRHGDRTIEKKVEGYLNDPYRSYDFYPEGDGQLTNAGKARAYRLGEVFRKRYNCFLGNIYYQPNVYAQSTAVVRCKMTVQLVLAALYPPNYIQQWNSKLPWQPVDFSYVSTEEDGLLLGIRCPSYIKVYQGLNQDPNVRKKIEKYNNLMTTLSKYTGENMTTLASLFTLYHTLAVETSLKLPLPEWTENVFPDGELLEATLLQYDLFSYNNKLIQYNAGGLLYKIINDMNEVINGTLVDRKINLYSAHDLNVAAMLKTLKIFDNHIPRFTSSVIIELHEKNGNYFVKVLHYLGIPSKIVEVSIPGCEKLCPYDKFVELTSAVIRMDNDPTCPITKKPIKKLKNIFLLM